MVIVLELRSHMTRLVPYVEAVLLNSARQTASESASHGLSTKSEENYLSNTLTVVVILRGLFHDGIIFLKGMYIHDRENPWLRCSRDNMVFSSISNDK